MRCRRLPQLLAPLALLAMFTASSAPSALAAQDKNAEAFYRAFYLESGLRDFTAAEKTYADIAATADPGAKAYLVPAMIGRARCLLSLGKADEARQALEAALAIEPGSTEARRLLDARPDDGIDPELRLSLTALVAKLGSAERDQAFNDLQRIGDVKLPFLESGLRSRDIAVVEGCAKLLGAHGSAAAAAILVQAYRDPRVSFPTALGSAFSRFRPGVSALEVAEGAFESSDPTIRADAIQWAKNYSSPKDVVDPDRFVRLFRRALKDAAPNVPASLAAYSNCDPRIVKALLPDLLPWLRTLDAEGTEMAIRSARELDPPIAEIDAFVRDQFENSDPRVVESALKWLETRVETRVIDANDAVTLLVKRVREFDPVSFVAASILNKLDATATKGADAEIHRITLLAFECKDVAVAQDVFSMLLNISGRNKTLTEPRLVEYFTALDPQWVRLGSRFGGKFVGSLINGARVTLQGESSVQKFLIARLRSTANGEIQASLYSAMRNMPSGSFYSDDLANAVLESPNESIRALYYTAISEPSFSIYSRPSPSQAALANVAKDLESASESIASNARTVAMRLGSPVFAPIAKAQWERATSETRATALDFYARSAGKDAIPELETVLAKPESDEVWITAQSHLTVLGDDSVMQRIVESAGTNQNRLVAINYRFGHWPSGGDAQLRVRRAEQLVASLAPEQFRDFMFQTLMAVFPAGHAPLVERGLTATDPDARLAACRLAYEWCTEAAEPQLLALLEHDTPSISAQAQVALDAIRNRRELRNATKLAIGFDRSQSIADARALLASDDPLKRRGGALALGALGDLSAIPSLLKLLDDKDASVRESALTALGKLQSAPPPASSGNATPAKDGGN